VASPSGSAAATRFGNNNASVTPQVPDTLNNAEKLVLTAPAYTLSATGARLALPILARMMELIPPAPLPGLRPRPQRPVMAQATDRLRLLFPPPGAVVELGGLVLRAAGGH
jgi:hypothetical protein